VLYAIAIIAKDDGIAINDVIDRGHDDLAIRVALKMKEAETPEQKHQAEQEARQQQQQPITFASEN